MEQFAYALIGAFCGIALGGFFGYNYATQLIKTRFKEEELQAKEDADRRIAEIKQKTDEQVQKTLEEAEGKVRKRLEAEEKELNRKKSEIDKTEHRLAKLETQLEKDTEALSRKDGELNEKRESLERKLKRTEEDRVRIEQLRDDLIRKTEEISGLTREEGKKLLLDNLQEEIKQEAAAMIRRVEAETEEIAEKKARQILTIAVQRCATDQVTETTVSVVPLPSDEMKGRIIGREGRNIRALEQATGVNIIIDDTPEAVVLSCFDPMRREIARVVIEKLIADGRIHPSRIEEIVAKSKKHIEEKARQAGEHACEDLGIHDMHPEIIKLLGRLMFRTSYGQNVLKHSVECAHIAEMISSELGIDTKIAKRATLLHDIGKAVTHEVEGPHAQIGAEIARKFKERPEVIHAIEAHHYEVKPKTLTAFIVITADSVSAARPGARRETLETYIKRLENLEAIATSFEGVEKSYAIQAGREIRIIVEPDKLNDNECSMLVRDVTKRIEEELQYPGQIKVVVVRETRQVDYAK
ncbi:MAG: ribonuclease Y [Sumerlaeia bacterium]